MKRFLFLMVVLLLSVSATAQLSLSWPASQATEVFSNCRGVTVSVVVHNDADIAVPSYTVRFRRNADYYLASSVRPLAPHSYDTLPLFQDAGLQPASYHIAVALLDSTDSIRTTIQVVYCRNAGIDSVLSPQPRQTVVEGDPFPVQVGFSNFGYTAVSSLYWLVTNVDGTPVLPAKSLPAMNYGEAVTDEQLITVPMGIYGSKTISITLQPNDQFPADNIATIPVFVKPAYNPQPLSVATVSNQCRMSAAPVSMSLINAGGRTIMANDSIKIGYSFYSVRLGVPLSGDASHHEEWYVLPSDWAPDSVIDIVFAQPANLDPSAWGVDISLRLTGWASHLQDSRKDRYDTITSSQEFVALHAPSAPIASDSHIPYASRTVLRAAQSDYLPIYWYADTSDAAFLYHASDYNQTTSWATPQYFGDTTYYLCVYGANGCKSDYTPLNVIVNRRVPYDAGVAEVLAPAYDKVYTECDTVVVRVCNYGTASLTDFPVKYSFYLADDVVPTPIQESVVEMFTDTLQPGQCGALKFHALMVIPDSLVNQSHRYQVRAWTDHPREMVRSNDTVYDALQFATLPESAYCIPSVRNGNGPTLVSVSFNTMSNQVAALPYTYTNFGYFDSVSRLTPVLHVSRGLFDSIVVQVVNVADLNDQTTPCTLVALIDYNRDGDFGGVGETVGSTIVCAGHQASLPVTIPAAACSGYMRMRLMLIKGTGMAVTPCAVVDNGHVQDYLLYVDGQVPAVDAALTRIASPLGFEIVDSVVSPVLYLANKGADVLHSATITYEYSQSGNAAVSSGSYQWSGELQPGCFTRVQLPQYIFPLGTTDVVYRVETPGDAVLSNNVIEHQYHRFHTVRCLYQEDFDNAAMADWWYAPHSGDAYDQNLWQLGTPSSAVVNHAHSGNTAWTTILDTLVVCGAEGNRSVLYSPYFDITIARPDTVEFYIHKDFLEGTRLQVEYLNASGNWVNLAPTSQRQAPQWYLSTAGFTGKSSDYVCVSVSMALPHIGMGNQYTQFRLIYTANIASTPTSRLDGCAIDNVRVTHQRGAIDVGIASVDLVPAAQVRRWAYPQITIRNFGYDTVCDIPVQYLVHGATEPVSEVFDSCLPPDSSVVYTFKTPFLVDMSFPIIFDLQANTLLEADIFWENDSMAAQMTIDPTDDDLELRAFLSPRLNEAASDSVEVIIRMCNNGSYPIDTAVIQLDYNQQYFFEQSIHFDDLLGGNGLEGGACFNYTIPQRYHVSIGTTELVAVGWIAYDTQTSNDTLELDFDGLTNSIDLEAAHVSFQTISQSYVAVKMAIRNAGARSIRAYVLSYWIDDDTTTKVVERVFNNPIASLTTSYYLFNSVLPLRDEPYDKITAVVYNIDDIDHSNDTTSLCLEPYVDLRVRKILILESADSVCLVRLVVENMGNSVLTDPFSIAAVINGQEISTLIHTYIHPEQVYELDFNITIPKDSLRHYMGSGWIVCDADTCEDNNQTSAIQVVNNFDFKESVPTVVTADSGVWVSDCFPNPSSTDAVVRFALPESQEVSVAVYGLDGRRYYATVQRFAAGMHQQVVSVRALPSGCYYYVLQTETTRKIRKMIVQH